MSKEESNRETKLKGLARGPYDPICNGLVERLKKPRNQYALSRPGEAVAQNDQPVQLQFPQELTGFRPFQFLYTHLARDLEKS